MPPFDGAATGTDPANAIGQDAIIVPPYGAEVPLRIVLIVVSFALWTTIAVSVIGLFYAVLLGLVFFLTHLGLVVHLRGSSVRLGPDQMPEIYERVVTLSRRIGVTPVPEVYLQQSNGLLNAFATRFGRARFVVLFSDLVAGCGDNGNALDFIIGHELGHLKRGHLRWRWFLAPAMLFPFLGSAYSRACEYTCDRFGFLATADRERGLDGLCVLAAGPKHAAMIDRRRFAAQGNDLNSPLMILGSWFSSYPPLARRLSALDIRIAPEARDTFMATAGAVFLAAALFGIPIIGGGWGFKKAVDDMASKVNAPLANQGKPQLYQPNRGPAPFGYGDNSQRIR